MMGIEDPNGIAWDKKGKIFWVSNFCGQNPIRCPSVGTFIYNNTIFVNDKLNPEIYVWPDVGDVHVYNNLIFTTQNGETIPTLLENDFNDFYISHNLFYDSTRIDLDSDLKNNGIYSDPLLLNSVYLGDDNPQAYQIHNNSPAINNGFLINGSNDSINFLEHNGGLDYFGNSVSHNFASNIGAFNGSGSINILELKSDNINLFPSITENYVNISIKDYSGSIQTEIFNISGDLISIQNGNKLSFEKQKSGIYFCKVIYADKNKTLRIVKL